MGTGKKEAARKERQGKGGDGMGNVKTKGENFYRYVFSCKLNQAQSEYNVLIQCLVMPRRSKP